MVRTKGIAATLKRWKDAQGRVPAAYKEGVERTSGWQAAAIDGKENYEAGVTAAMADSRREKGLSKVSDSEWKTAAANKGSTRIASGMAASEGKFNAGMSKVLSTIEGVSIPARTQDGMANIDSRLKPIAQALMDMKKA